MIKTVLKVDGMACGMCESHVNDAIRRAAPVKKVTSSCKKGETVILSEQAIEEELLRKAVEATGYRILSMSSELYEKRGLFRR